MSKAGLRATSTSSQSRCNTSSWLVDGLSSAASREHLEALNVTLPDIHAAARGVPWRGVAMGRDDKAAAGSIAGQFVASTALYV